MLSIYDYLHYKAAYHFTRDIAAMQAFSATVRHKKEKNGGCASSA
jgi:hypothetical protein